MQNINIYLGAGFISFEFVLKSDPDMLFDRLHTQGMLFRYLMHTVDAQYAAAGIAIICTVVRLKNVFLFFSQS